MSTQSTAYCLLAVAKFTRGVTSGKMNFSYQLDEGKTFMVSSAKPLTQIALPLRSNATCWTYNPYQQGKGMLFTRIIMEGIPEAGDEKEFSNNLT